MNLGSNAIKYGRPSGRVELAARPAGAAVRISVIDDGIGIPVEKQARIFEPFQRAGQEVGPIEGTGIGLTISKRLAELMRGELGFTSAAGRGSTFWIELPLHRQDSDACAPAVEPLGDSPLAASGARHTVVYIEDNPSNIAFMRELLDELPSIELLTAPTAEIGLELIRARRPDAVLLDVNLPGMSGFEAAAHLRAWPETCEIPLIGLSAAALPRDAARAKAAGFHRYLTKPVSVPELMRVLEQLLEGR